MREFRLSDDKSQLRGKLEIGLREATIKRAVDRAYGHDRFIKGREVRR